MDKITLDELTLDQLYLSKITLDKVYLDKMFLDKTYYTLLKTFSISDVVSFRAPKQPREVLKDDLNWYEAKLKGEAGCLGSVDRKASKRSQYRVKRKSMAVVCIHKSALLERLSSISIPNYMGIQSVKWVPLLQCHLSKPFVIIYVIWVTT